MSLALRVSLTSAGSPSQFAKPLRLLSTGIELMGKVAEEQCAIAEEMFTLDLLAKLEQETKDWQPNLALPDRQPVAYDASDRQKYADAFAQLSVITSKGTNRFLSRHSARLEQQQELISQPFITLRQAMKEKLAAALIEQLSLIASTLDKNSYSIENCEIVSKAFQDVLCVFPPAESFSGLAPQDITHSCVRWLEWHQTSVRVLESTAAALAQRGDIQPCESCWQHLKQLIIKTHPNYLDMGDELARAMFAFNTSMRLALARKCKSLLQQTFAPCHQLAVELASHAERIQVNADALSCLTKLMPDTEFDAASACNLAMSIAQLTVPLLYDEEVSAHLATSMKVARGGAKAKPATVLSVPFHALLLAPFLIAFLRQVGRAAAGESAERAAADSAADAKTAAKTLRCQTHDALAKQLVELEPTGRALESLKGFIHNTESLINYSALADACEDVLLRHKEGLQTQLESFFEELVNMLKTCMDDFSEAQDAESPDLEKHLDELDVKSQPYSGQDVDKQLVASRLPESVTLFKEFRWANENTKPLRDEVQRIFGDLDTLWWPWEDNATVQRAGKLAVSMTLLQAACRQLAPGEDRGILLEKVSASLINRGGALMRPHECIQSFVQDLQALSNGPPAKKSKTNT